MRRKSKFKIKIKFKTTFKLPAALWVAGCLQEGTQVGVGHGGRRRGERLEAGAAAVHVTLAEERRVKRQEGEVRGRQWSH